MATFYNQATLSYNGDVTSSNITTGIIAEVLSAEKNAVVGTYSPDSDVVFIISIVNTGSCDFNNLTITDDLGAYSTEKCSKKVVPLTYVPDSVTYYVNGEQKCDPEVRDESPLVIKGIDVPANGSVLVIYAARPNSYAPFCAGSCITNTAVISKKRREHEAEESEERGCGRFDDITVSETICPNEAADLAICKSLAPTEVEENGRVTYTFVIQNFGNTAACKDDSVIFRDIFDPALHRLSAEFNGEKWKEGENYEYNRSTGEFVSLEGQITVPAAEFTQRSSTGEWSAQPGVSVLVISGNI